MIKAAIVGCGRISKRHIEAIDGTSGILLTTVCDTDVSKMNTKIFSGRKLLKIKDYTKIKNADIISVCTPSGYHPTHAAEIAEKTNAEHIVVEKPVSLTVRETIQLYKRIEKEGKRIIPVYQNRYNPLVQFIKDLINSGKLGTIYQFVINIFWNRNNDYFQIDWHGTVDLDGGVLYTQASHYVDMLLYIFGPVQEAKGIGGRLRCLDVQDTISAVISHQNGTVGSLNCTVSTYKQNYQTEFTVIGSKGTIRLQGTNLNTISFCDVEGIDKPEMDFSLDHIYGKGHDMLYKYIEEEKWYMFPTKEEVISGIELMERLSHS